MENNDKKKTSYWFLLWLIPVILFFIFGIPVIINYFLFFPFPKTPSDLGNIEWLSFWATFSGSIIGGSVTFIGVKLTLSHNEMQNKKIQDRQDEIRFRDVYPIFELVEYPNQDFKDTKLNNKDNIWMLNITKEDFDLYYTAMWYVEYQNYEFRQLSATLKFKNIGMALAIGIKIHVSNVETSNKINDTNLKKQIHKTKRMEIGIPKDQSKAIIVNVDEDSLEIDRKYTISFFYKNIYKNPYEQKASLYVKKGLKNGEEYKYLDIRMDSPDSTSDEYYKPYNEWDEQDLNG